MSYYVRKYWLINSIAIVLQIIVSGMMVLDNLIMMEFIQRIFEFDMQGFLCWLLIDAVLWVAIYFFDGLKKWTACKAVYSMNNHVRRDMIASMIKKGYREFHMMQNGEYLSQLTNDINSLEKLAWNPFLSSIGVVARVVFSIVALAKMHWSLLVVSSVVAVIILSTPKLFSSKAEGLSAVSAREQALATSKMKDLLAGVDILRFFGKTDRFVEENRQASEQIEKSKYKLSYVQSFIGEGIASISTICEVLVIIVVGILTVHGQLVQSAIFASGNLCGAIYNGLAVLGEQRLSMIASKPYFEKISTHADEVINSEQPCFATVKEAISVENLSYSYGDKIVLCNLSLRFEEGGKYALTGPSGCGKSTLLKLLLGWLPDYEGRICFDGRDAKDFIPEQLQQQMSYIEQNVFLFNTTIRDNITLGDAFTEEQLKKALQDSALEFDLANMPLGVDTPVGEDGSNLSGGQKQRVAIARALIHNRSILLVDEGTSALDKENADIVENRLLANPDLTLILVSHHLSPERKEQFDQVYKLEPGCAVVQ